jgi:NitT/TauT family transport system substrate-binding protein
MVMLEIQTRLICTIASVLAVVGSVATIASPSSAQTKLTIGSSVHSLFSLPLYIADNNGLFKTQGLAVEVINFQGGATATPALLGGSTERQSAATENMLKVVQQGQPITAVMSVQSTFNGAIMVRKELAEKLGRKPTLQDLKGLRVGTLARGGMSDMAARFVVEAQGLTPRDVTLVPIGGYDKHLAALQANDIDASFTVEPVQSLWSEKSVGAVYMLDLLKQEGPEVFQDMNWITLQGKKEWVEKNRETVRKVVRALVQAQAFIATANIEEITELAAKSFPNIPKPVLQASINRQLKTYTPTITERGIEKNNELLIKTGNLRAPVAFGTVVDTSYKDLWDAFGKK